MNVKTLTAVALLLAAVPAASFAQTGMPARPTPPTLDFAAADTDGSGAISAEEWTAYATTLRAQMRAQRIEARADALMTAADSNHDGSLTREELASGMTALADQRQAARGEGQGPAGGFLRGMMSHFRGGEHDHGGWQGRGGEHGPRGMHGGDCDGQGDGHGHGMRGEGRGPINGQQGGMQNGQQGGQMGGQMGGMPGRGGPGDDGPMRGGDRAGMGFARIDSNGDGQISPDELAHAQAMLNWLAARPAPAGN